MRMILSDIGKVLWKALSAAVTTTSNIAFCAGSLVVGIIGEILFGMLSIMFGIPNLPIFSNGGNRLFHLVINNLTNKDMARRYSKTAAQQCRFYEVDNIFEYMVETYINGNHSTLRSYTTNSTRKRERTLSVFFWWNAPTIPHGDFTRDCLTT